MTTKIGDIQSAGGAAAAFASVAAFTGGAGATTDNLLLDLLAQRASLEELLDAGRDESGELELERENQLIERQEQLDAMIATLPARDLAGFLGKIQLLAYWAQVNFDLFEGPTPGLVKNLVDGLAADANSLLRAS